MRAKSVPYRAYVFDFDETLVKTDAKIHIYSDGRRIRSISPEEYNRYDSKPGETVDLSDFDDPRFILNAKPYKMWPALKNIDTAKKMGRSASDIYILTARSPKAQLPIHNFLRNSGIDMPIENIMTVGSSDADSQNDIASEKARVLKDLRNQYAEVFFYDDSPDNIRLAAKVGGIKTRLIDSKYIK
jgi:FMN phosphatase YigB (HAD superfamily)